MGRLYKLPQPPSPPPPAGSTTGPGADSYPGPNATPVHISGDLRFTFGGWIPEPPTLMGAAASTNVSSKRDSDQNSRSGPCPEGWRRVCETTAPGVSLEPPRLVCQCVPPGTGGASGWQVP